MKKLLPLLLMTLTIISCEKEPENELVGKWNLIEVYSDPGDGSGSYQPVVSDKIMEFNNGGEVRSNGSLCSFFGNTDRSSSGMYTLQDQSVTISGSDCAPNGFTIGYELDGSVLTLTYQCFEGCGARFERD